MTFGNGSYIRDCLSLGIPIHYYEETADKLLSYLETFIVLHPGIQCGAEDIKKFFSEQTREKITLSRVHIVNSFSGILGGTNKPTPDRVRDRYKAYLDTLLPDQKTIQSQIIVPINLLEK